MREFTAIIARDHNCYAAACVEMGIERVLGVTVEDARDRLIDAMQRHVDALCESGRVEAAPLPPESLSAYLRTARHGSAVMIKVPEYLITRN